MRDRKLYKLISILMLAACLLSACSLESCKSSISGSKNTIQPPKISLEDIPGYTNSPSIILNDNVPFFSIDDYKATEFEDSYEHYGDLDELGRCTSCSAIVGEDTMPDSEEVRGDISSIEPTGWHHDVGWERCHLIAWCLTGQNDNILNLITGSHYFNVEGMLPYEVKVANYVRETGNRVLYRVTPLYNGDDMVASGVVMEAMSIEDNGEGLGFCVFCYNVFPNLETVVDYATGEVNVAVESQDGEKQVQYILNTSTMKIHRPECKSVMDMAEHNKKAVCDESVDELITQGYSPCGNCHPE